jgi:hypothetical protein
MCLLDELSDPAKWEQYYTYKSGLACQKQFLAELRRYIDELAYLPVCESIRCGGRFPLPKKAVISKTASQKKRTVYSYPDAESMTLKLLTWLLLRRYDGVFSDRLWSFRPARTAKDAIRSLTRTPGTEHAWAYKADISNYFNSVDIPRLLPVLEETLADDEKTYAFLASLLTEPEVLERGKPVTEQKGIMAGTPQSAFYANLFLKDLDALFSDAGVPYARYSDDIIIFAPTREEAEAHAGTVRAFLAKKGLAMNPEKEQFFAPEEGWDFLGFHVTGRKVDLSRVSVAKMKGKMRRKTRALKRWADRNGIEGANAAKAFIRIFNRKLFESAEGHDLTWAYWFFPVLTTDVSLREIDLYAQECIRYLASGTRTKARFNVRYEDVKAMGYRCLVHEYYSFGEEQATEKSGR